jgi:CubicO group peptidase (beta-lactamase class C family)
MNKIRNIDLRLLVVIFFYTTSLLNLYAKKPASNFNQIDSIVNDAMARRVFPGCQVLVVKEGVAVYDKCFGNLTYDIGHPVSATTMYDLASLSKTTGTLFAIMKLYDSDKLQLNDKASKYLDFLKNTDKENITITDLLFHESGLPAYISFGKKPVYTEQVEINKMAMQTIARTPLQAKTYVYSCVNFMLLKEIAESITRSSMDEFLNSTFYGPMGLKNTAYLPLNSHKIEQIAPTIRGKSFQNGILQGIVHDPDAAYLGGVSGNAGLFATASDVAAMYQLLLNNGEFNGNRYLCTETCRIFTTTVSKSGRRGLGFDKSVPTKPASNPCCTAAPKSVFGHTGYTGTCCWVDPENKLIYVFLSNRTYPVDGENKLAKMSIRPKIQQVIYNNIQN